MAPTQSELFLRHAHRVDSPGSVRDLCAMNNNCSVHSLMTPVDAERSYAGSWTLTLWDDLIISRTRRVGLTYERLDRHISDDTNDSVFIHFNVGSSAIGGTQMRRDYVLAPMTGSIFVHNEPVRATILDGGDILGIALPRAATRRWRHSPEDLAGRDYDSNPTAFRVLHAYLEALSTAPNLSPGASTDMQTHIAELAGLWLGGLKDKDWRDDNPTSRQQARLFTIKHYLQQHYEDPHLSTVGVGRQLGLSERLVQQVLHESGTTFSRLLLDTRLEKAAQALKSKTLSTTPVTEIAYNCGFSDLSGFYKAFNKRFGEAPGRYRR